MKSRAKPFQNFKRKCSRQWHQFATHTNMVAILVGGGVLLLAGMLVRGICGSPYDSIILLHLDEIIPPVWAMTLFWMVWYFLLGAVFTSVMCSGENCGVISIRTVEKYRGGMYFMAMIFLGFLWYPLFFVATRILMSALLLLIILGLCIMTGISYWKVSRLAGILLFSHAVFLLYALILNIAVVFHG